ncbi:MAG TPA: flagellar hook-length control protein FliK, partial [Acidimicrobiia bacterium]|nr:flagellar hook-length control protein FliK [Acidimicrobiia bacterium]
VTSVPAPAAPSSSAPHDSSVGADRGSADTGFATVLAGMSKRGSASDPQADGTPVKATTGKSGPEAGAPGAGEALGAADGTTDPVTLGLLAALAGTMPLDARPEPAAAAPTPGAGTVPSDAKSEVAAAMATAAPLPEAPGGAAGVAEATAGAAALADVAPTTAAPTPNAKADATTPTATAADQPAPTTTPTTKPAAPATTPTAPTGAPAGPSALDAATAAVVTATAAAAAAAAATTPVRAEPAPKSDGVADNALVTAAAAAADHAPAPEAVVAADAPAAPAPPTPPPAAAQLAAAIRPLPRGADGSYQLKLEMRPPELGRVDMRIEMREGVIHASIHAEHPQTAELVRAALDDLRARLDADGVRTGQLTVDAQGAGTSQHEQASTPERLDDGPTPQPEPSVVATAPTTNPDSLLDVRI